MCLRVGQDRGDIVTTLFGNNAVSTVSVTDTSANPKKHGWLPLLTVLFLISYSLMTGLIVEQGQTIESQRVLIRELFRDSTELSNLKSRRQQAQSPSATTQPPVTQIPSAQKPSTQIPSTQYPSTIPSGSHRPRSRQPRLQTVRPRLPRQDRNIARRMRQRHRNGSSECRRNQRQIWWTIAGH